MSLQFMVNKKLDSTIISAYACTLISNDDTKELFINNPGNIIWSMPAGDKEIFLYMFTSIFKARIYQENT